MCSMWSFALVVVFASTITPEVIVEQPPPNPDGTMPMQKLRFKAANLTDEEHFSTHMPSQKTSGHLMCDGCRSIVYQFRKKLKKVQGQFKKGHKMTESEIIDLFDEICEDKDDVFNGYGIKDVEKEHRLSGEGLETSKSSGVLQGGGKWPSRLREMCFVYIGEIEEELMYNTYLNEGGPALEDLVCRNKTKPTCKPRKKGEMGRKEEKDEL